MESVFFDVLWLAVGLLVLVVLPVFALVWVPRTFKRTVARQMSVAIFALLLLAGVTAFQIAFLANSPVVCALPLGLAGVVELFYLLGWLFWERKTGMSTRRRTGYMLLVYLLLMGNVVVGWWAYSWFPNPQTRARIARAKSEIRNLAVNLETYYIDHDTYPPAVDISGKILFHEDSGTGVSAGYVPWLLTTPTAYTSSLPMDPFHKTRQRSNPYGPYRYATNGATCWIMTSSGPDGDDDIAIDEYPDPEKANCQWREFVSHWGIGNAIEYDSTNGTKSTGDILRTGP